MPLVRYEQAVYGSFPFWDLGYAVLAHSPGCRPEWLDELGRICQNFGERPHGVSEVAGLFALRMTSGPWVLVGVGSPGSDDRGRPGALAFHALFLTAREFRKAGFDPFAFADALRREWGPQTRSLPSGTHPVADSEPPASPPSDHARRIASALMRGRRVALESGHPIDELARDVWCLLPTRVRQRASVATWAFGNGNRFDLAAFPRLAGIELDRSYLDPDALSAEPLIEPSPPRRLGRFLILAGILALVIGGMFALLWHPADNANPAPSPNTASSAPSAANPSTRPGPPLPDPSVFSDDGITDADRRNVAESLVDIAERFGIEDREGDLSTLMARFAEHVRYRGPFLKGDERVRLVNEPRHYGTRALDYDAHIRLFTPDRPLPPSFSRGPLRWQLATLMWSFHLEPKPGRPVSELPYDLSDALSFPGPVRGSPLVETYPTLEEYTRFLRTLPTR